MLIEIAPDYPGAINNLGYALKNAGRTEEALEIWQKQLLSKNPNKRINFNIGIIFFEQGQYQKAIEKFSIALETYPEWLDVYEYLADANIKLGNYQKAIQVYIRALKVKPDNPYTLDALAAAYAETDQFQKAVQTAQKAIQNATESNNKPLADQIEKKLKLYKASKPYRPKH